MCTHEHTCAWRFLWWNGTLVGYVYFLSLFLMLFFWSHSFLLSYLLIWPNGVFLLFLPFTRKSGTFWIFVFLSYLWPSQVLCLEVCSYMFRCAWRCVLVCWGVHCTSSSCCSSHMGCSWMFLCPRLLILCCVCWVFPFAICFFVCFLSWLFHVWLLFCCRHWWFDDCWVSDVCNHLVLWESCFRA